jgi:hypothetical protein
MWRLHDRAHAPRMKQALEALPALIPAIHKLEVGVNFAAGDAAADLALYSEFATRADLEAYIRHPEHQQVVALIREWVSDRRVADYET